MKITIELQGMLKKFAGWKAKHIVEVPAKSTLFDALNKISPDVTESKRFGFAIIDGKKIKENAPLKEGDKIKIFPKSFGG